jgi:hypothetical protein
MCRRGACPLAPLAGARPYCKKMTPTHGAGPHKRERKAAWNASWSPAQSIGRIGLAPISLPDTFSGKRTHSLDRKTPAVFGTVKGQTTGQMWGTNLRWLVFGLHKQKPEVEAPQAKESFVPSIGSIKLAAVSMIHASRA